MDNFGIIQRKLEDFIKKFYLNELIKGFIFFIAIGLLYFLLVLFIEYLFWLSPRGRTILFWSFVAIEVFLFVRLILYPILKLFQLSKGIDEQYASIIIGRHFPEVGDKLLNILQLRKSGEKSDLLLAGIEQKSKVLRPIPFSLAIDFRKNKKYLQFAALPIVLVLLIVVLGKGDFFTSSYQRMVDHRTVYQPPAPFEFTVLNEDLSVREGEEFRLEIMTEGRVIPEEVTIHYEGQRYFMNQKSPGVFEYSFGTVTDPVGFNLSANEVESVPYALDVIRVPKTLRLIMEMDFPEHTGMANEKILGTGNATIPEGTSILWQLETESTENVKWINADSVVEMTREKDQFYYLKTITDPLNYTITTSNKLVQEYENFPYRLRVVRDKLPTIEVEKATDSLNTEYLFFQGKVADDYGISSIEMVYFPVVNPDEIEQKTLYRGGGTVENFIAVFPDSMNLKPGEQYEIFFQVTDNDGFNGYKTVKSSSFLFRKQTDSEKREDILKSQNEAIRGLENLIKREEIAENEVLEEKQGDDSGGMNYRKRKQLQNFISKQRQQNRLFQKHTKKLKQSLGVEKGAFNNEMREELERRLAQKEDEIEKSEELLRQLEEMTDKIEAEDLQEKLKEFSRQNKGRERSLEQLLELTKRYYVQEKVKQLSDEFKELGETQKKLSEDDGFDEENQDSLNSTTERALDQLEELKEENNELKKPFDFNQDESLPNEILNHQKKAGDKNDTDNLNGAKEEQRKAGDKLKELGDKMNNQMQMAGAQQMEEDVDMLRQILDNLVMFSFEQERVLKDFQEMGMNNPSFSAKLREQSFLEDNFKHIDDSIYALALRNPMISENITEKLMDVGYQLELSLDRLADNEIGQGIASQQYVITGSNDLAFFLSKVLDGMMEMLGMASGAGKDGNSGTMQLPDIIRKQEEIGEQLRKGMEKGRNRNGSGEGDTGSSERMSEDLYRIYQEQQILRMNLERELERSGNEGNGNRVIEEMKELEEELLEKGFHQDMIHKMDNLEHKLLELDDAEIEQGQRNERQAEKAKARNKIEGIAPIERAKEYFNTTEILNRQILPLRQIYRLKVNQYFEGSND